MNDAQHECLSSCVQKSVLGRSNFVAVGESGDSSSDEPTSFFKLGRLQMDTLLIVLLVLFLLGGGGWGYSRWRRN